MSHKIRVGTYRQEGALPQTSQVDDDMRRRRERGIIKFDLSDPKWFDHPESFWSEFQHTGQILVPSDFEKWLIGQERMKEEFFLHAFLDRKSTRLNSSH